MMCQNVSPFKFISTFLISFLISSNIIQEFFILNKNANISYKDPLHNENFRFSAKSTRFSLSLETTSRRLNNKEIYYFRHN